MISYCVDMKKFLLLITVLFVCGFCITSAYAVEVKTLYRGNVPVASRSQVDLNKAISAALRQVLIKISGNSGVVTVPSVQEGMTKPSSFVQSYGYSAQLDAKGQQKLMLHVNFNAAAVKQVLREARQALWGRNRPLTAVWIVVAHDNNQTLLASNPDDPIVKELQQNADRRGLPIIIPMMDLEDVDTVSLDDISNLIPDNVLRATNRYGAANILIGTLSQSAVGEWQGNWLFELNGEQMLWQTNGQSAEQVVTEITDNMADAMAARFAVLEDDSLTAVVRLRITGVNGLEDYSQVIHFLRGLTPVTQVDIAMVEVNDILLDVTTSGGEEALVYLLGLSHELVQDGDLNVSEDDSHPLDYRWNAQG